MIDSFTGEYRFLSNFYPCKIQFNNIEFPSVEHAYVAAKTLDRSTREMIAKIDSPGKVKRFGRTIEIRPDWDDVKLQFMNSFLKEKFIQGSSLADKLEATGSEELIEGNHWGDTFWGVCNGVGQNHLGKLLMAIRNENRMYFNCSFCYN